MIRGTCSRGRASGTDLAGDGKIGHAASNPYLDALAVDRGLPVLCRDIPHTQILPRDVERHCSALTRRKLFGLLELAELEAGCVKSQAGGQLHIELSDGLAATSASIFDLDLDRECNVK